MTKNFPAVTDHSKVRCFNCDASLAAATAVDFQYPPKRGKFGKTCDHCKYITFYGLKVAHTISLDKQSA